MADEEKPDSPDTPDTPGVAEESEPPERPAGPAAGGGAGVSEESLESGGDGGGQDEASGPAGAASGEDAASDGTAPDDGATPGGDASGSSDEPPADDGVIKADHPDQDAKVSKPSKPSLLKRLARRFSIYILLFLFVLLLAGMIILIAYEQSRKSTTDNGVKSQDLSASSLQQLADSDTTVGNNKTVLKVQSSTIFGGQVLVKQGLEVAGNLRVGGTAAFNDIDAAGSSQFGQVSVNKDLSVAGNAALQGATVSKSLQVGGSGTFNGPLSAPQITTDSLQLNGDLTLTHHIKIGGGQPGRSNGPALGGGGSVSVSGSDTSGTVNINTGGGPPAGCFVTVSFTARYGDTPNVLITPVGAAAGGLDYYVNRSTSGFSICDASPPPAGSSFAFDYFVVE